MCLKKKKVICFLSETTYTEKVAVCVFFTVRYETLAVATEAESRQDPNLPLKTGGKRLTVSTNTHIFYFFFDMIVCLSVLWLVFKDCGLSDIWYLNLNLDSSWRSPHFQSNVNNRIQMSEHLLYCSCYLNFSLPAPKVATIALNLNIKIFICRA